VLDPLADRQGGEHDREVGFDRVAGAVVNGLTSYRTRLARPSLAWAAHAADSRCSHASRAYTGRRRFTVGYDTGARPASSSTRRLSSLLTGSMIRASTRSRNTASPPAAAVNPSTS